MTRAFIFIIIAIILFSSFSPCNSEDEKDIPIANKSESAILVELEKQVKEALQEYGFSDSVVDNLSFSGTITISTPRVLPKSIKTVSQKYSCAVKCSIDVLDVKSNSLVCITEGTFEDIGRTPRTARKYALGKVVKPLFECIKEKKSQDPQLQDMDNIFKTLEQEEDILEKHIESLSLLVDGIMDGIADSLDEK
ncbi:MAG: hypothetical protein JRJ00_06775 [Deltaproteobacteria bacterium]|nr:hypothetical protein [Deltaproteobacteria bacterium]